MGKLLRIRALSETLTPTAPAWSAMPSPTIIAGSSGSYTLPVTNATSVTWAGSVAQPAWLTLVAASPPRLTWTAAPAAATIDATCELIAVGAGGSVPSGKFGLVVGAATGFFAGWVSSTRPLASSALEQDNTTIPADQKQVVTAEHGDGRLYTFGGDWANSIGLNSGAQTIYSVNLGTWAASPYSSGWRWEFPFWAASGQKFPVHADNSAVAWDTKRGVFWQIGAYFYAEGASPPNWGAPNGALGFVRNVGRFDPKVATLANRWTDTGIALQPNSAITDGNSERYGRAYYDPVLDVVFSGWPNVYWGRLQIWDCAASDWLGTIRFNNVLPLETPSDGWVVQVIGIDPVGRKLWVQRSYAFGDNTEYNICTVTLPSSRASLPAKGASVDWTAAEIWSNPNDHKLWGGATLTGDLKRYFWRRGPVGNTAVLEQANGRAGHSSAGNGTYDSATTGILVDLLTGVEEATSLPIPKKADGTGWNLPFYTGWSEKHRALWYMGDDESEGVKIESNAYLVKPKAVPSWAPSTLYQWAQVIGAPASSIPAAVRNAWSAAEPAGAGCYLESSRGPFIWSRGAFRQKDATLLFHSGGGSNGQGNGIIALTCNAETPAWSLPMPPTPASLCSPDVDTTPANPRGYNVYSTDPATDSINANGQKTPVAVHAYTSCHFVESHDAWIRFGACQTWRRDGYPSISGWRDVHAFKWSELSKPAASRLWSLNYSSAMPSTPQFPPDGMVQHPWRGDVIFGTYGQFRLWRAASNDYQSGYLADGSMGTTVYGLSFIDPLNDVAVYVGTPGTVAPFLLDLSASNLNAASINKPGHAVTSWGGPDGASFLGTAGEYAWDDDNQCTWCVKARRSGSTPLDSDFDLFKIVLTDKATCTFSVTKVTTSGTKPTWTGQGDAESLAVKWSRELGGLLVTQGYNRPVSFIRTSARA
jgi:hypothetical protein